MGLPPHFTPLDTPIVTGTTTEAFMSTLSGVSVWYCLCDSATAMQPTVTKLSWPVVEIKSKMRVVSCNHVEITARKSLVRTWTCMQTLWLVWSPRKMVFYKNFLDINSPRASIIMLSIWHLLLQAQYHDIHTASFQKTQHTHRHLHTQPSRLSFKGYIQGESTG